MDTFTTPKPYDPHVHLREGAVLRAVAPLTARQCAGAIAEPNLVTPITTNELAHAYELECKEAFADYPDFKLHLLAYLTDTIDPDELHSMIIEGPCIGAKFYPRGATTNSDSGITDVSLLYTPGCRQFDCVRAVGSAGGVVQLHCELNFDLEGFELDPYDKEAYFFKEITPRLLDAHPGVKFSCEHITTSEAADFMDRNGDSELGCSITAHHLLSDRRDMFRGGLRSNFHCLPPIKREVHRHALLALVGSDYHFVYAGTDSAPHPRHKKEAECCAGGIFTAHAMLELYAHAYEEIRPLDFGFINFMSINSPQFYGLTPSEEEVTLVRESWQVTEEIMVSDNPRDAIRPYGYKQVDVNGKPFLLDWKLKDV